MITEKTKGRIVKFAEAYYKSNSSKYVENSLFEYCVKQKKNWKCNTCEYKEECGEGEHIWDNNPQVIEELVLEILSRFEEQYNITKKREKK